MKLSPEIAILLKESENLEIKAEELSAKKEKAALKFLGIWVGDTVDGKEHLPNGLGDPWKYVVKGAKVVNPDFPQYKPSPYISVRAVRVGKSKEVLLGEVNGKVCVNLH